LLLTAGRAQWRTHPVDQVRATDDDEYACAGHALCGNVGQFVGPRVGTGWGLGFAVRTNPEFSNLPGAVGSFQLERYWGTYFWIVSRREADRYIDDPGARPKWTELLARRWRHFTYAALSVPTPDKTSSPVTISPDILKSYVGTYDFAPSLKLARQECIPVVRRDRGHRLDRRTQGRGPRSRSKAGRAGAARA